MTGTATGDYPEEWNIIDDIHLEAYKHHSELDELAEYNAAIWFALDLLEEEHTLNEDEIATLEDFLQQSRNAQHILTKHLGPDYVQQHIDTIGDTDE